MTIKIKDSGSYISKVNGKPIINNQYALDIDSDRNKSNQVIGMVKNDDVVNTMHDSLQNYMNKTSSKNQSIFDLLKRERNELSKFPNIVMNIVDSPPKLNVSIPSPMKMIMKQKTRKLANNHNGISSKLFDFTNIEHAPNPNPNPNPNSNSNPKPKPKPKLKNIYQTRKRQRKRASRKNRKYNKRL